MFCLNTLNVSFRSLPLFFVLTRVTKSNGWISRSGFKAHGVIFLQNFSKMFEIWTDEGSGGRQDGSFWRVNAPPGFVALGDVACNNWSQPTPEFTAKYACIRQDLLSADAELSSTALWNDSGSGAERHVSLWPVQGYYQPTGCFKAHRAYNKPSLEVYTLPIAKIYSKECSNN